MMEKEQKIDLTGITFCIPIRIESFYRIQNLKALLRYLNRFIESNFIILEASAESNFENDMEIHSIRYLFVKDDAIIFHRTKYINQMLSQVQTPYAAIWDTDAIAPIKQIEKAYLSLRDNKHTLIYPFSGAFIALNELISMCFYKSIDINTISSAYLPQFFPYGFYSVGGAYMVDVRKYLRAGGENEHFYGWGPEDAERNARIQILELGVTKIDGPMYHLFHTRGINSIDSNRENGLNNKKEFCKICGMSTSELKNYIKTWDWNKTI